MTTSIKHNELLEAYANSDYSRLSNIREVITKLKVLNGFKPLRTAFELSKNIIKIEEKTEAYILFALVCISLEGFLQDPRDNIGILSLLSHSAKEKGYPLESYIEKVKHLFDNNTIHYLSNWVSRTDKNIENFGFSVIRNNKGVLVDYETNNIIFNH